MDSDDGARIGNLVSASADVGKTFSMFLASLAGMSYILVFLAVVAITSFFLSNVLLRKGNTILSTLEFATRCELYPAVAPFVGLLETISEIYSNYICWANSLGLVGRLFSTNFLLVEARNCTNGGDIMKVIITAAHLSEYAFQSLAEWILSNPITSTLNLYRPATQLTPLASEAQRLLNCLCEFLDFLWKWLDAVVSDSNLPCALHQILNGALGIVQITISSIVKFFINALTLLFEGSILLVLQYAYTLGNAYPSFLISFERLAAGLEYLGEFLNDVIRSFICVIVAEVQTGINANPNVLNNAYSSCMNIAQDNIDVLCLASRAGVTGVRAGEFAVNLVCGFFRFLNPLDDFRWTSLNPNIVWDTIRKPLSLEAEENNPNPHDDSRSSIINIFPTVSNSFLLNNINCNDTYDIQQPTPVCYQCTTVSKNSLEDCLCTNLAFKLDNLLEMVSNVRIIEPILCGLVFQGVRIGVSVLKFVLDLGLSLPFNTIPFLSSTVPYDRILNEIGGPKDSLGGLISFPNVILLSLRPGNAKLQDSLGWITYTLKFILEIIRIAIHFVASLFGTVNNAVFPSVTPLPLTIPNYVCVYPYGVGGENCINLEDAFQWLRIPRNTSLDYEEYVPLVTSPITDGTLEAVCYVVDLGFLADLDVPGISDYESVNICCGPYNVLRIVVDLVELVLNLVFSVLQTVIELSALGNPYDRIFVLDYLACNANSSSFSEDQIPCSQIDEVLSDVYDTLNCPCLFIQQVELIDPSLDPGILNCACNSFTSLAALVANLLIPLKNSAEIVLTVLDCVDPNTGNFEDTYACNQNLVNRVFLVLNRINNLIPITGNLVEEVVCVFAGILDYECLNSNPYSCINLDFVDQVRQKCPTYLPNSTISLTQIPTDAQMEDCIFQCQTDPCDVALELTIALYESTGGANACPNPCTNSPCKPSDRLKLLALSLFDVIASVLHTILTIATDVIVYAIEASVAGSSSLGAAPSLPITFASYFQLFFTNLGSPLFGTVNGTTITSWGAVQFFGDAINCIIGPPGCYSGDDPSSNGGIVCLGDLFITLGDVVVGIYTGVLQVVVDILNIAQALLDPSQDDNLGEYFKDLIVDFFNLVFDQLIGSIVNLLKIAAAIVASIISLILGGSDAIYTGVYNFFLIFIDGFQEIINIYNDLVKLFTKSKKRQTGEEYFSWIKTKYNLSDETVQNMKNSTYVLANMTNDTTCYGIVESYLNSLQTNDYSADALLFRACYALAITPMINNGNPQRTYDIPYDATYNLDTAIPMVKNITALVNLYYRWNSLQYHSSSVMYYPASSPEPENTFDFFDRKRDISSSPETEVNAVDTLNYTTFFDFVANSGIVNLTINHSAALDIGSKMLQSYETMANGRRFNDSVTGILTIGDYITNNKDYVYNTTMSGGRGGFEQYAWFWNPVDLAAALEGSGGRITYPATELNFGNGSKRWISSGDEEPEASLELRIKRDKNFNVRSRMYRAKFSASSSFSGMRLKGGKSLLHVLTDVSTRTLPALFKYYALENAWKARNNDTSPEAENKRSMGLGKGFVRMFDNPLMDVTSKIVLNRTMTIYAAMKTINAYVWTSLNDTVVTNLASVSDQMFNPNGTDASVSSMGSFAAGNSSLYGSFRLSMPERLIGLSKKLKRLRLIGDYMPEMPEQLVSLANGMEIRRKEIVKRSLVTINCGCDCKILDDFAQQLVDTTTYCYEKYFLHRDLDAAYVFRYPLFTVVPSPNASSVSSFDAFVNKIFGFDLAETVVDFFTNTNTDRSEGPIGLVYYISTFFSLRQCTRENLVCANGSGLEIGLLVALGLTVFVVIVLSAILPPASQLSVFVINVAFPSAIIFFVSVTMHVAWDWRPACLANPDAPLTHFLIPALVTIPLFPECMASEALRVLDTYIFNPCAFETLTRGAFDGLIANGTGYNCNVSNACAAPLQFLSCYDLGFTSPLQSIGVLLLKTVPSFALYLKNSCLVRGGCFNFLEGANSDSNTLSSTSGILGSLFSGYSASGVISGSDPVLNSCVYFVLLVDVFSLVFVLAAIALAVYFGFWAIAMAIEGVRWAIALVSAPPVSYIFAQDPEDKYYGSRGQSSDLLFDM